MGKCCKSKRKYINRFKFNGQQLDPITRQYYLRARFYNPVIARFTQEDTYRGDGLNLYSYCTNNPIYYVDPTGHYKIICEDKANRLIAKRENGHVLTPKEERSLTLYEQVNTRRDDKYSIPSHFRKGVRDIVWTNAPKNAEGKVISSSGRVIEEGAEWHMGHIPGYEFIKHQDSARRRGISREQFLDEHNDPTHYIPKLPEDNLSHRYEAGDELDYWRDLFG